MNSRGLSVSRGHTFEETGVLAAGFEMRGGDVSLGVGRVAVAFACGFLRPASPCLPQYVRKVSYVAGNGGDAPRYASQTRYIV